jgi:hypothetical protein
MATYQTVVNLARLPLNDDDPDDLLRRYRDAELHTYALHGVQRLWRMRPDLFVGGYSTPPSLSATINSTVPLPDSLVEPLADYVTARAQSKDDESVTSALAPAFFNLFAGETP